MKIHIQEGQDVQQGQLLINIDERPYQAMLESALSALARDKHVPQPNVAVDQREAVWVTSPADHCGRVQGEEIAQQFGPVGSQLAGEAGKDGRDPGFSDGREIADVRGVVNGRTRLSETLRAPPARVERCERIGQRVPARGRVRYRRAGRGVDQRLDRRNADERLGPRPAGTGCVSQ